MKLSSKQHDYYDGPFRYNGGGGNDKKSVFVRNKRLLPDDMVVSELLSYIPYNDNLQTPNATVSYGVVGFCGNLYPFVKVARLMNVNGDVKPTITCFYNFNHMLANMPDLFRKTQTDRFSSNNGLFDKCKVYLEHGTTRIYEFGKGLLVGNIKNDKQFSSLFLKERIAYFVAEYGSRQPPSGLCELLDITAYPVLKDYGFFKVFDTFAAFQQIEMFLQNQIMKPDDPYIEPVPDVVTAESHGFNKESFRQERTTKKPRLH